MPEWWGYVDQDLWTDEPEAKPEYYVDKKGQWTYAEHYKWEPEKYMFMCLMCNTFCDSGHLTSKGHISKIGQCAFQKYNDGARRCIRNVKFNYEDPHGLEEEALKEMEKYGVKTTTPQSAQRQQWGSNKRQGGHGKGKGKDDKGDNDYSKEGSKDDDDPWWKEDAKDDPWKEGSSWGSSWKQGSWDGGAACGAAAAAQEPAAAAAPPAAAPKKSPAAAAAEPASPSPGGLAARDGESSPEDKAHVFTVTVMTKELRNLTNEVGHLRSTVEALRDEEERLKRVVEEAVKEQREAAKDMVQKQKASDDALTAQMGLIIEQAKSAEQTAKDMVQKQQQMGLLIEQMGLPIEQMMHAAGGAPPAAASGAATPAAAQGAAAQDLVGGAAELTATAAAHNRLSRSTPSSSFSCMGGSCLPNGWLSSGWRHRTSAGAGSNDDHDDGGAAHGTREKSDDEVVAPRSLEGSV